MFVFSAAAFVFLGVGFAFGEFKKAVPEAAAPVQKARPAAQPLNQDIALFDITLDKNQNCRIWVSWQNKGNVKIDRVLREKVFVNGMLKDSSMNKIVLESGAFFSHGVGADPGITLAPGTWTVTATIDADNVLPESNEENNTLTKKLTCP
jgi:hypothetical protein